jgi:rubrerythrin
MKNLTSELIAKAKTAKSAEELFELAKANNVELTEEEAKTYFEQLNTNGAISDDDLESVAGGYDCGILKNCIQPGTRINTKNNTRKCPSCNAIITTADDISYTSYDVCENCRLKNKKSLDINTPKFI